MKILVLGDFAKDQFIYGQTRQAPDGPFPVFIEEYKTTNWGCAGNVVKNLKSLAPEYEIEFICNGVPITKTRYVDKKSNYTLIRIDENDETEPILEKNVTNLIDDSNLSQFSACVFSDYGKGFLSTKDIYRISNKCANLGIPTFLDTKRIIGSWAERITFLKINEMELNNNLKNNINPEKYIQHCVYTLGERGAIYKNESFAVEPTEVIDLSGCGDVFFAGLICKYLQTKNIGESINYANKAARIAAGKKGVIAIKREEVV